MSAAGIAADVIALDDVATGSGNAAINPNFCVIAADDISRPGSVQQAVATIVGDQYQLSYWIGNTTGGGIFGTTSTVNVSLNEAPTFSDTNATSSPTTQNWEQFTHTFVATGTATTLAFLNGAPLQYATRSSLCEFRRPFVPCTSGKVVGYSFSYVFELDDQQAATFVVGDRSLTAPVQTMGAEIQIAPH